MQVVLVLLFTAVFIFTAPMRIRFYQEQFGKIQDPNMRFLVSVTLVVAGLYLMARGLGKH